MSSHVVQIESIVRHMRGGSQSQLVKGTDGRFYVAKFAGNPQGTRTLINEWIATSIFQQFSICVPEVRVLHLSETLRDEAQLHFSIGNERVPVEPGLHFGSECPVDPDTTAIFDYLPRKLSNGVINQDDFAKAFVIDKWLCNGDLRQAIFVRVRGRSGFLALRAYLLDHGLLFGGNRWEFHDAPLRGLCFDRSVYSRVDTHKLCDDVIEQIETLKESDLSRMVPEIPDCWFEAGDDSALGVLLSQAYRRITSLRELVERNLAALGRDLDVLGRHLAAVPLRNLIGKSC